MPKTIEISHRTILFIIGIILGGYVLYQIRDILYLLALSYIIMTAMRPLVDRMVGYKVPRVLSIVVIYLLVFGFIFGVIGSTVPTMINQTVHFVQEIPLLVNQLLPNLGLDSSYIAQQLAPVTQNVVRITVGVFNNALAIVSLLVFTFYFLMGRSHVPAMVKHLFGNEIAKKILVVIQQIDEQLGAWVRGQLLLMFTIGLITYIGLTILRVEYALPLAVLAGLLEVVPIIGPNIAAIPAILLGLTVSPLLAISIAALYFVVQQLENTLIVPFVMKQSLGFSPLLTIIAILIGARFEGVIGAILAVPAVVVAKVLINTWFADEDSVFDALKAS